MREKLKFLLAALLVAGPSALFLSAQDADDAVPIAARVCEQHEFGGQCLDLPADIHLTYMHAAHNGQQFRSLIVNPGFRFRLRSGIDGSGGWSQWFESGSWPSVSEVDGHERTWKVARANDEWVAEIEAVDYDPSALTHFWSYSDPEGHPDCGVAPGEYKDPWDGQFACAYSDTQYVRVPKNYILTIFRDKSLDGLSLELEGGETETSPGTVEPWKGYDLNPYGFAKDMASFRIVPDGLRLVSIAYDDSDATYSEATVNILDSAFASNSSENASSSHTLDVSHAIESSESWSWEKTSGWEMMAGLSATEGVEADEGLFGTGVKESASLTESFSFDASHSSTVGSSGSSTSTTTHEASVEVDLDAGESAMLTLSAAQQTVSGVRATRTWQNIRTGEQFTETGTLSASDAFRVTETVTKIPAP